MAKVEKAGAKAGFFPKGGNGKMFGKGHASPMPAAHTGKPSQGAKGGKFPKGGNGKMFGKGSASPARSGHTAKGSN